MIDLPTLNTIIGMGLVTYFTRLCGFFLLRNRELNAKQTQMMEIAPGCVFIAIIAPEFVTGTLADVLALCATVLAATKMGMLGTIIIAVVCGYGFNYLLS